MIPHGQRPLCVRCALLERSIVMIPLPVKDDTSAGPARLAGVAVPGGRGCPMSVRPDGTPGPGPPPPAWGYARGPASLTGAV